jgi:hypothetical protein
MISTASVSSRSSAGSILVSVRSLCTVKVAGLSAIASPPLVPSSVRGPSERPEGYAQRTSVPETNAAQVCARPPPQRQPSRGKSNKPCPLTRTTVPPRCGPAGGSRASTAARPEYSNGAKPGTQLRGTVPYQRRAAGGAGVGWRDAAHRGRVDRVGGDQDLPALERWRREGAGERRTVPVGVIASPPVAGPRAGLIPASCADGTNATASELSLSCSPLSVTRTRAPPGACAGETHSSAPGASHVAGT